MPKRLALRECGRWCFCPATFPHEHSVAWSGGACAAIGIRRISGVLLFVRMARIICVVLHWVRGALLPRIPTIAEIAVGF
jgi:hypothetical protein